jgi:hypothetical protein
MKHLINLKYTTITAMLFLTVLATSCNKLIEIPPSKNQIESSVVFQDSTTATAALLGAYYTLGTAHTSMKFISLYADEFSSTSAAAVNIEYANGSLLSTNSTNATLWSSLYSVIFQSNSVLEGVQNASRLSISAKTRLSAEARFLRAYAHFYLLNFYDHVPLVLSTDVDLNRTITQASADEIYNRITQDLREASESLGTNYQGSGRVRANQYAAAALLARIYLYRQNWQQAADHATKVISSGSYNLQTVKPEDVFLSTSPEAILQFWVINGFLTDVAQLIPSTAATLPVYPIHSSLYQAFEASDQRKSKWIGLNTVNNSGQTTVYPYPAKYKARVVATTRPEFIMALRLGEQYLIRAEAMANLNQVPQAVDDLNMIRTRSGLAPINRNISQTACLEAIAKERRIELFGEWGHRFLDLKRTAKLDQVIGTLKPAWKASVSKAFPIPNNEIIYNNKLKQNDGY